MRRSSHGTSLSILALTVVALAAGPAAAQAATVTVPAGTADSNAACSASPCPNLRSAIAYANANPGTTISLAAGTYALSLDELKLTANATIVGQGASQTKIKQTAAGLRVLEIPGTVSGAPTVALQNLEITGGNLTVPVASNDGGGGIRDEARSLTLQGVRVDGNQIVAADGIGFGANGGGGYAFGGGIAIPYTPPGSINYTRSLTVLNSTISNNTAQGGSGGSTPFATVSDPGGEGGAGFGGGIYAGQRSNVDVENSMLQNNHAFGGRGGGDTYNGPPPQYSHAGDGGPAQGGALFALQGLSLQSDTIAGNVATGGQPGADNYSATHVGTGGDAAGGGVWTEGNTVDIESSTLSGNAVTGGISPLGAMNPGYVGAAVGGAIDVFTNTVTIDASTVAGNTSSGALGSGGGSGGGNIDVTAGRLYLEDSIVSGGTVANVPHSSGGNCHIDPATVTPGTITDQSHNLEDTNPSQCGLSTGRQDVIGPNPLLGPLADNGGPTLTRAPAAGSPAIGAGECFWTPDQRGFARPSGGPCDIGAYETHATATTTTTSTSTTTTTTGTTSTSTTTSDTTTTTSTTAGGGGGGTPGGGGGTPGGGGGGTPGGGANTSGSPSFAGGQSAVFADGTVQVTLGCGGSGACKGTIQLTVTRTGGAYSARVRRGARHQVLVIGSARFQIAAGRTVSVPVRLTGLGRRLLRRHPRGLAVTGRIRTSGSTAVIARRLTLSASRRRRRHR